jgi:hypothetical protein
MALPAQLEAWWREHPERWSQRHRHAHGFPAAGTRGRQIDWFRRQFLKLADKASSTKKRGDFLRLAFMATLKGENARGSDDAMAQYAEFRKREDDRNDEARALRDKPSWEPDETGAAILEYFKNMPYRTKDRKTPEEAQP